MKRFLAVLIIVLAFSGQAYASTGPTCANDLNWDETVGFADLTVMLGSWGPCTASYCAADLNEDGTIGFADLTELLGSWGPCPTCLSDNGCNADEFCSFELVDQCGNWDYGICVPRIEDNLCPAIWDPVCGCDGENYGNTCEALIHSTSPAYAGECAPECATNDDCPDTTYCVFDAADQCGANTLGTCEWMPQICIQIYDPVCGCDGNTHSSQCHANSQGVNVAYDGECL